MRAFSLLASRRALSKDSFGADEVGCCSSCLDPNGAPAEYRQQKVFVVCVQRETLAKAGVKACYAFASALLAL